MYTAEEVMVMSAKKKSKRLVLFGFTDLTLIVGCTIKFIDEDSTLRSLLLMCKDTNDILKQEVLK